MERKRENRGRFRLGAEMEESSTGKRSKTALETDESHSDKSHPNFFLSAIGEPFVKYKRPRYDFEKWDWMLFQWPYDWDDANFEITDRDLEVTFEADKKRFEEFIEGKQNQNQTEKPELETPVQNPGNIKNCIQTWLEDSDLCLADAST